jgi:hypothetical protein
MLHTQFLESLERLISNQIKLSNSLMEVTTAEYAAVLSLDSSHLLTASQSRVALVEQVQIVEEARRALIEKEIGETKEPLQRWILRVPLGPGVTAADRVRILHLVGTLRNRMIEVRTLSAQLQSLSGFGLEVVNGCLSLFHAAKQIRNQVYSARGIISEKSTPRYSRAELTIREA